MGMKKQITLVWLRRDLRLHDNTAISKALENHKNVVPLFIFDKDILGDLENKKDKRVNFIHNTIVHLQQKLIENSSSLISLYDKPLNAFKQLSEKYNIEAVYSNEDYEPYSLNRDKEIKTYLEHKEIPFHQFKDQCIFAKNDILKNDGTPYKVFTPFSKKWKSLFQEKKEQCIPLSYSLNFAPFAPQDIISLEEMGFSKVDTISHLPKIKNDIIQNYGEQRNFLKIDTTRLGPHLRFGTIGVRTLLQEINDDTFLNQLIWRDFYMMILFHFPHVVDHSFRKQYDLIPWRNNEDEFEAWKNGTTGYPIVDAAMNQLNTTGFMHNRARMIVASFLCKHLLIDWRWGEAYFAEKLLDYDLALNNGNWQWAAGTGTDAQPYFRVFNPASQQNKFDKKEEYIHQWISSYNKNNYIPPIVEHSFARVRAIETYKKALSTKE